MPFFPLTGTRWTPWRQGRVRRGWRERPEGTPWIHRHAGTHRTRCMSPQLYIFIINTIHTWTLFFLLMFLFSMHRDPMERLDPLVLLDPLDLE